MSRRTLEANAKEILEQWSKHEVIREMVNRMTVCELEEFVRGNE